MPPLCRAIFNQKVPSLFLKMSPDYSKITPGQTLLVVALMSAAGLGR
jgi:hypothetical protein